jgi:hypothetical protein
MARPREWDRAELLAALQQYVEDTEIPILAEFAHNHGVLRQKLYEMDELRDAIKACAEKKEWALEAKALSGKVNCSMAIFSLKQLGWKDTHEQTHKGDAAHPVMITAVDSKL